MAETINVGQDLGRTGQGQEGWGEPGLLPAPGDETQGELAHLLCGEVPLCVEEILLVLGKDRHIILLGHRRVRPLLNDLQVDGVGLICRGPPIFSVPFLPRGPRFPSSPPSNPWGRQVDVGRSNLPLYGVRD